QKKIESELKNPKSSFYLLYDGDLPAAYMKVNLPPAQSDLNDRDSLELERIYVKKEYKGRGFGRQLLEQAISIAKEEKCRYLWLGVWEKNEKALEFYTKMGFVKFGSHSFRMGDEIQNDFVMKITL
ncbi:MAG: GNAT family N-acetyltransferase, partial [Spirochaetales bacterium]|nr:GNAT family N-acetyltransferase [Spirochaetales bacterium]